MPPWCRANSQENSAVRALPTWSEPLRRGREPAADLAGHVAVTGFDERADALDLDLDDVAVVERADALGRAGQQDVARAAAS